jgi:hypothetical protein
MKLKLKLSRNADSFINYLQNFSKIQPSLLLEIDINNEMFVAKCLSESRASVRYSTIDFESCNIGVAVPNEKANSRINLGILNQLPKFIRVIERFNEDLDSTESTSFDIDLEFTSIKNKDNMDMLACTVVEFISPTLSMKFDGFMLAEFKYMTDEQFFSNIFNVGNPIEFNISSDIIDNAIKTSEIAKNNSTDNSIIFMSKGKDIYVTDSKNEQKSNYCFKITTTGTECSPFSVALNRDIFIKMFNKSKEDYSIIIGLSPLNNNIIDRVLFNSLNTNTKMVISCLSE